MNIIILMGGSNSRIGKEKAFLKIGNKTILEIMLEKLNQVRTKGDGIIIVTKSPSRISPITGKKKLSPQHHPAEVVSDLIPGAGPLGGIYSGLMVSSTQYNLVFACDMPFLNVNLIQYMLEKKTDYDVLIPKYGDCFEPLHAIYSRSVLPLIKKRIEQGIYRIQSIFPLTPTLSPKGRGNKNGISNRVKVKYITEREMEKFGNWRQFFFNINTLSDLKRAQKIFEEYKVREKVNCAINHTVTNCAMNRTAT